MGREAAVSIWTRITITVAIVSGILLLAATPVAMLALLAGAIPVVALDTQKITPTPDKDLQ